MNTSTIEPFSTYSEKQAKCAAQFTALEAVSDRYSTIRGILFVILLVTTWLSVFQQRLPAEWTLVALSLFAVAILLHARLRRGLQLVKQKRDYYEHRLNHLEGDWAGQGSTGSRYRDENHPYTSDLDVFGPVSLFEYISCARTRVGEDTLAQWLSTSAAVETIVKRQEAIQELVTYPDIIESIALLDFVPNKRLRQSELQDWIRTVYSLTKGQRVYASVCGILAIMAIIAWGAGYGLWPLLLVIALEVPLYISCYRPLKDMTAKADQVSATLKDLSQVIALIETQAFNAILLEKLIAPFKTDSSPPSSQINQLCNLIYLFDQTVKNQLVMPLALLLGLPVQIAFALDRWRRDKGPRIASWLDAIGQIESLVSLARYAYENPANGYPDITEIGHRPVFDAQGLTHPLIAPESRVQNDIRLDETTQLIIVSGSNMSGKSTLLRSIGIAVVLCCCGAPVQAKRMRMSPFNVGCAMRANDSLSQGESLFYAVITRIKRVVDLARSESPVLFLLDEILQGTNSNDRLTGAKGIINQLLDFQAVGLVTTHDLALTRIVDSMAERAANIHFEDQIAAGRISFDYKIRPGVIRKSNALALMKMVGLQVEDVPGND